jgi:hypothetical protein
MMAHPPEFAEDLVGWFLPPACREEVLGDLCESYQNVFQYALGAATVIPRVTLSQIRRNTGAWIFLLTTCGVCYSVAAGVVNLSLKGDPSALLRLAIPVVPAVLILLIRNGFAALEDRRRRAITLDIVVAMGVAALTQLILFAASRYDLMLLRWWPSGDTALAWLFIIVLRAIFPPEAKLPPANRSLP